MQVANEKNVAFFDRLLSLKRVKEDGEVVMRGSEGGQNMVRLIHREGEKGGGAYVAANCSSQQLLSAPVAGWPSKVTEDGLTIHIFLCDFSMRRNGYRRQFILTFLDELGALRFFETFVGLLPTGARKGDSYWDMRSGVEEKGGDEDEHPKNKEPEEKKKDEDGTSTTDDEKENYEDNEGESCVEDEEGDKDNNLAEILEMESNWGESQSLFDPIYPFRH